MTVKQLSEEEYQEERKKIILFVATNDYIYEEKEGKVIIEIPKYKKIDE